MDFLLPESETSRSTSRNI